MSQSEPTSRGRIHSSLLCSRRFLSPRKKLANSLAGSVFTVVMSNLKNHLTSTLDVRKLPGQLKGRGMTKSELSRCSTRCLVSIHAFWKTGGLPLVVFFAIECMISSDSSVIVSASARCPFGLAHVKSSIPATSSPIAHFGAGLRSVTETEERARVKSAERARASPHVVICHTSWTRWRCRRYR